ncbi:MAG TPA: hypothetical protein ENK50_01100, partial [Sedimenticola sp.]|nr:hypothetical protein [Sedimenticola sp.]
MNMLGANGQLFGWSEATWLWLDQAGILVGDVMLVLTIAGGLWAWFSRDTLRRWFMANRFPAVGDTDENNETWSALVFTVSHSVVPCWVLERKRP